MHFICETAIIKNLPAPKKGFWSELFRYTDKDDVLNTNLFIAVRINGMGYEAETDVVIFNLCPNTQINIKKNLIENIGVWLQHRGFNGEVHEHNADYHKAYGCIMGSERTGEEQPPANLYFGGKIEIHPCVKEHSVFINGRKREFKIVVAPNNKPIRGLIPLTDEDIANLCNKMPAITNNWHSKSGLNVITQDTTEEKKPTGTNRLRKST